MGKSQRDKGARAEREVVSLLRSHDIPAERVPLSGAAHYQGDGHDITVASRLKAEIKIRASGFSQIYQWLGENDLLMFRRDRDRWLVVMDLETFMREFRG